MRYIQGSIQGSIQELNFSPDNTYILKPFAIPEKTPGTVFIYGDQKSPQLVDLRVSEIPMAIYNDLETCLEGLYDYFEHESSPVKLLFQTGGSCLIFHEEKFLVNKLFHLEKTLKENGVPIEVLVFYSPLS